MVKKIATKLVLLIAIPVVGIGIFLLYFFKANEAPILYGELEFNVPYKTELALDLYQPTQQVYEKVPVLVYIHGGAWITGGKESVNNARFNGAFNRLREQGYAVVSPNYTLAELGKSPFPNCIEDAFDALKWVEDNADTYQFDLENVGILGESAGAHIGLMTLYADAADYTEPFSFPIQYMVDVYGPSDLERLYLDQRPLIDSVRRMAARLPEHWQERLEITSYLFGFNPETDSLRAAQFATQFSPDRFVSADSPDLLLIHGDSDRVVPLSQSHLLKAQLESFQIPHELHVLSGVDHAFGGATEAQKSQVQEWISEFVLEHYRPS